MRVDGELIEVILGMGKIEEGGYARTDFLSVAVTIEAVCI